MSTPDEVIEALPCGSFLSAADLLAVCPDLQQCEQVLIEHTRAKDLRQVVPGLYWKGRRTLFGMSPPDTLGAALAVAGHAGLCSGVGPASWSATNLLGLSTQIPRLMHVALPAAVPHTPAFVQFHLRPDTHRDGLNVLEVALIEVLHDDLRYAESSFDALITRAQILHDDGLIDIESLRRAGEHERPGVSGHLDVLAQKLGSPTG